MTSFDVRQNPDDDFIERIRSKYPVERTVDKALTRKMKLRSGPGYAAVDMDRVHRLLLDFLSRRIEGSFNLSDLHPLSGGASKEQFVFNLDWIDKGIVKTGERMIVRRSPCEASVETDGLREFQIVKAMEGVVPAPKSYWIDESGEELDRPSRVYSFVSGVQKPADGVGNTSGIGTHFPPQLRNDIGNDFVEHLAAIHRFDPAGSDLSAFDVPMVGTTDGVIRTINWWARVWEEDRLEDVPLMAVAEQWLRTNAPTLDHVSVIHGDYRSGNFLFDERQKKITAILDWELAYLGDRHADLAWAMFDAFSTVDENGGTLISGLMPREVFLEKYQEKSGLAVDPRRLAYFQILELWKGIVLTGASSARVAYGLKTHQNILLGWVASLAYPMTESLRLLLGKEA